MDELKAELPTDDILYFLSSKTLCPSLPLYWWDTNAPNYMYMELFKSHLFKEKKMFFFVFFVTKTLIFHLLLAIRPPKNQIFSQISVAFFLVMIYFTIFPRKAWDCPLLTRSANSLYVKFPSPLSVSLISFSHAFACFALLSNSSTGRKFLKHLRPWGRRFLPETDLKA